MQNEHDVHLHYWQRRLEGSQAALPLPFDYPVPQHSGAGPARKPFMIPRSTFHMFKDICRQEDVTLFIGLLSVYKTFLLRYSGKRDLTVGTITSTPLTLRSHLDSQWSFRELMQNVRTTFLEACAHQSLPFDMLVNALGQPYRIMFLMQDHSRGEQAPQSWISETEAQLENCDFSLRLVRDSEGLSAELIYRGERFDPLTIKRMSQHFVNLLSNINDNIDQPLALIPMLSAEEQHELIVENNIAGLAITAQTSLQHLFAGLHKWGDATLLQATDWQISYSGFADDLRQRSCVLAAAGCTPGGVVLLAGEPDRHWIRSALAVLQSGGMLLPVTRDILLQHGKQIMLKLKPRLLIISQDQISQLRLQPWATSLAMLSQEELQLRAAQQPPNPDKPLNLADEAALLSFCRTDGQLHILRLGSGDLLRSALARQHHYGIAYGDLLAVLPSTEVRQTLWLTLAALVSGAALLDPSAANQNDLPASVTHIEMPNEQWLSTQSGSRKLPDSLRWILLESHRVPTAFGQDCRKTHPGIMLEHIVRCDISGDILTRHPLIPGESDLEAAGGLPSGHLPLYILDEHQNPLPPGINGTLYIGGYCYHTAITAGNTGNCPSVYPNRFSRTPLACLVDTGIPAAVGKFLDILFLLIRNNAGTQAGESKFSQE